jgi:hypothetical protein
MEAMKADMVTLVQQLHASEARHAELLGQTPIVKPVEVEPASVPKDNKKYQLKIAEMTKTLKAKDEKVHRALIIINKRLLLGGLLNLFPILLVAWVS